MLLTSFFGEVIEYATQIGILEFLGLVFGLLCVYFLIKQNILTWICGIIYVLISFVIFWNAQLYGDFILHIFFLILNIYGWYHWIYGSKNKEELPITSQSLSNRIVTILLTTAGIFIFYHFLNAAPSWFEGMPPASLPMWDSTTSVLSITGMWLTARKKIDNWYYWLAVDVLATGIYYYKELYFYSILYFIYIGLAIAGYLAWKKSMSDA